MDSPKLRDMRRINLVFGKNNVGKTSLLRDLRDFNGRAILLDTQGFIEQSHRILADAEHTGRINSVARSLAELLPNMPDVRTDGHPTDPVRDLPWERFGSGARRVSVILAAVSTHGVDRLLVDEIETSLHHSTFSGFWRTMLVAARDFAVQIVATTQSFECAVSLAIEDNHGGDVKFYRIRRNFDRSRTVVEMDADIILASRKNGLDVR